MKIPFTDKERVLRSPYYKCNKLWDKLDSNIQLFENINFIVYCIESVYINMRRHVFFFVLELCGCYDCLIVIT